MCRWKILNSIVIALVILSSSFSIPHVLAKEQLNITEDRDHSINSSGQIVSYATNSLINNIKNNFEPFGVIEVGLDADNFNSLNSYSIDALLPLFSTDSNLLFTQLGIRNSDKRDISNAGVGYRYLYHDIMVGFNIFHDYAWDTHSQRYGTGLELWSNSFKLSLNGYKRISDWKQSQQHTSYDERPANGWDIYVETWLPGYPELGGRLAYEKYYGNNVSLVGFDDRYRDPYALSVGATYTPVPAVTSSFDVINSKSSSISLQAGLKFTYRIGVGLKEQFSSDQISVFKSLPMLTKDIVHRNNNIVMNYKKKTELSLNFPPEIHGPEGADFSFYPVIKSSDGLDHIELNDAELLEAGGKIISNTGKVITIKMPVKQNKTPVLLTGIAIDKKGHRSKTAQTKIYTTTVHHQLSITPSKLSAYADGNDGIDFIMHVSDVEGKPIPDESVSLYTDGGHLSVTSGKTNSNGDLITKLTSTESGEFHVRLIDGEDETTHAGVSFIDSVKGNLTISKNEIWADGKDSVLVTMKIENQSGRPLSGELIQWESSGGILSAPASITDENGTAVVTVTGTSPGEAVITASYGESRWISDAIRIRDSKSVLKIFSENNSALANGSESINLTASISREDGKAVAGRTVLWKTSLGVLSGASSVTDSSGNAHVSITSLVEGHGSVSASLVDEDVSSNSQDIIFNEKLIQFLIHETPVPLEGESKLTLILEDQNRDPREGETVYWSTTGGTLSDVITTTDVNGLSVVKLKSETPGVFIVVANVKGNKITARITFR